MLTLGESMKRIPWLLLPIVLLLSMTVGGCATSGHNTRSAEVEVGDAIDRVAKALEQYHERNGRLPQSLQELVPQYLSPNALSFQHGRMPFLRAGLIYMPNDQIADPENADITMLAFASTE